MSKRNLLTSNIPMTTSMFWTPTYLPLSAWLEHIPFAFWITDVHRPKVILELGTHYGASYFAFCQAISQLGLDARSYAVDTWKGDEHAGFYGEEVFRAVKKENDAHYTGFSRLVRGTFEESIDYFSDGSIDIIHIDGYHTYDSVKSNFEQWKIKLSPRGLVLFHDTNVRERNFGVFRFMDELRQTYPMFDFTHCHGLSCVAVGSEQNDAVRALLAADSVDEARRDIRAIFSRLGRACSLAYENTIQSGRESAATVRAQDLKKQVDDLSLNISNIKSELAIRTRERDEAKQQIQKAEEASFEHGMLLQRLDGMHVDQLKAVRDLEDLCLQVALHQQEYTVSRQSRQESEVEISKNIISYISELDNSIKDSNRKTSDIVLGLSNINHSILDIYNIYEPKRVEIENEIIFLRKEVEKNYTEKKDLIKVYDDAIINSNALETELEAQREKTDAIILEHNKIINEEANKIDIKIEEKQSEINNYIEIEKKLHHNLNDRFDEIVILTKIASTSESLLRDQKELLRKETDSNQQKIKKHLEKERELQDALTNSSKKEENLRVTLASTTNALKAQNDKLIKDIELIQQKIKKHLEKERELQDALTNSSKKEENLRVTLASTTNALKAQKFKFKKQISIIQKNYNSAVEREGNLKSSLEVRFKEVAIVTKMLFSAEKSLALHRKNSSKGVKNRKQSIESSVSPNAVNIVDDHKMYSRIKNACKKFLSKKDEK